MERTFRPRCPGKNAGPAPRRRVCRAVGAIAVHAHAFADEDDLRGPVYLYVATARRAARVKKKTGFPTEPDFFGQLACATLRARASAILLAGVEATSPRTHN